MHHVPHVIERVRQTCSQQNIHDIEEALETDTALADQFINLFATWRISPQPGSTTQSNVHAPRTVPDAAASRTGQRSESSSNTGKVHRTSPQAPDQKPAATPTMEIRERPAPPVGTSLLKRRPLIQDASPEEQAIKSKRLKLESTVVTEKLVLDPPPRSELIERETERTSQTPAQTEKREKHATAAEKRQRSLAQRGIGDVRKVRKMERNSAANTARESQSTPAAARAERLRQIMLKRKIDETTSPLPPCSMPKNLGKFARGMQTLRARTHAQEPTAQPLVVLEPAPSTTVPSAASSSGTALVHPSTAQEHTQSIARPLEITGLASSSSTAAPLDSTAIAHTNLARAARLEGINTARDLRYTLSSGLGNDVTNRGLQNLGNTCYGNALLFALAKVPAVRRWISEHVHVAIRSPMHNASCPLCMLARDVTQLVQREPRTPHIPEVMLRRGSWNPAFGGVAQQDVHEAFQRLMEKCDEMDASAVRALPQCRDMGPAEFTGSAYRASTPYNQIFGNLQRVRITCEQCSHSSEHYERAHAHDLSLANSDITELDHLLAEHFGREPLDAGWQCEQCLTRGRGMKSTEVMHWPPVLAISFKRFEFNVRLRRAEKLPNIIGYPMLLPLQEDVTYNLRAVIIHQGVAGGGHYVAYVRAHNEQWYYFNDGAVPRIVPNPMDVLRREAYMLIYER